ncbi:c-type cytochrome [Paenibacillus hamazuiensis]|uniref:c-type cytochrome n=1 Tax=Paenibacillus hamazuiensis TaxID=2936508 RepID=UPI002010B2B9|nr:cytochrome c [Paenibacillus hamazuiensis]
MRKLVLFAIAAVLIVSLAACGTKAPGNTAGGTTGGTTGGTAPGGAPAGGTTAGGGAGTVTVDAQAVFKQNCVACHGDNLEGKMGGNTNLQKVGSRRSKDQIVTQISNGGNGMMAFKGKLSDVEINALADWLSAKK